ncbi:hypothetical protein GHT09_002982 [Marmota monax]|uniref:WxxW domain-containing protein n=1 Tax=Marmota monax TaxID=9995 RepID=A0A834QWQ6_MARMO|nr:hypothetical protein GHT09_002982 [Marmota monax]
MPPPWRSPQELHGVCKEGRCTLASPHQPWRTGKAATRISERAVLAEASEWTSWFNVDHPGGDGDFESLAAIRFYYGPARVCQRPLALEARTTDWALPSAVGERVHLNPTRGFWCLNREQPRGRRCSNYHVRFRCPLGEGGVQGGAGPGVGGAGNRRWVGPECAEEGAVWTGLDSKEGRRTLARSTPTARRGLVRGGA